MPQPIDDIRDVQALQSALHMTGVFYLQKYNITSPRQSGVEREWQALSKTIDQLSADHPIQKGLRDMFHMRVQCLLCPRTYETVSSLTPIELEQLLLERRLLIADILETVEETLSILLHIRSSIQRSLWPIDQSSLSVRDFAGGDIPSTKGLTSHHTMPRIDRNIGKTFSEFMYSKKHFGKRDMPNPLLMRSVVLDGTILVGYASGAQVSADYQYETIRGSLDAQRTILNVHTIAASNDHIEETIRCLIGDLLTQAGVRKCTRLEKSIEV